VRGWPPPLINPRGGDREAYPLSRAGDSMLCARLQAVLRGGNPGARYPMTSVGVCGALPRLRGRWHPPLGRLPSHSAYATEPGMYKGPMPPCASLTIGLASEATLHGWRPLLTSRARYSPRIRSFGSATKTFQLYHSVHSVPYGTDSLI